MAEADLLYDLGAVRRLLLAAFSAEDLRRFCQDRSTFRPIVTRLSEQQGLDDVVGEVIDYCDTQGLFDQLLAAVQEQNPVQFARFESQLRATEAGETGLKILKPGSVLLSGRYRIERYIARGGFGSVYLAEDTLLRERVAIKELIPNLVGDEDAVKRFLVEAKAMMHLAHPRIVHTHDVFEAGGNYYTVMEYMPGGSLEDQIKKRKAMPMDDAVRILAEVCDGLAYAHAQGAVHCDLKPSNILLAAEGSAKVTDFGAAHVSEQLVSHSWITQSGFAGGTLPYMSPEQTDGVRDDPRVDVYALGAVLYRALTGRMYLDFEEQNTPRAQADNVQRIYAQLPVPPSIHNRHIPAWLDTVVLKALAKPLEERYAGAAELKADLLSASSGPEAVDQAPVAPPAPVPSPSAARPAQALTARLRRVPAWIWLAVGGAAVLVIILAVVIPGWIGGRPHATATVAPGRVAGLTAAPPTVPPSAMPTWTPIPPTPTLTQTGVPLAIESLGQGRIAFTSYRDGNYEVYVMNADGSGQTRLTSNTASDYAPAWSPDGKLVAFVSERDGNAEIYVMDGDGGGLTNLTDHPAWDAYPAWSPDGRRIAFQSYRDGNHEIYVMNADGSGQANLTNSTAWDLMGDWSPDGRSIIFSSSRGGSYDIYIMNVDGSGQMSLMSSPGDDWEPACSPDGQHILFTSKRDGNQEIYVMDAGGTQQTNLTNSTAPDYMGNWSPDGRYILFASEVDRNAQILVMNADGSGVARLTHTSTGEWEPDWSPR